MSVRYSKYFPGLIFITDLLLLNWAFYSGHLIQTKSYLWDADTTLFLLFINITWLSVAAISGNFKIKRPLQLGDNINKFMASLIYHLLIVFVIFYFFKLAYIPRFFLVVSYVLFFCFVVIYRSVVFFCLDFIRKKGYNNRQVVIIGDEEIAQRLLNSFSHHPEYGYNLADFIAEERVLNMAEQELTDALLSKKPDEIFICYKQMDGEFLKRLVQFGDSNFIKINVVSDLILNNNGAQLVNYNELPILHITSHPQISMKIRFLKRAFDIAFSASVLIMGFPAFLILAIITKLTSRGPVFYKQQRIGRNEKPFYIHKFRSMRIDAEKFGPQLAREYDPRVTKWGRMMRKTRLDELPQFWNVLKGDMSVVGPRPERQHFIEQIVEKTPNYKKLLRVRPGVTSIGQVHYGYAENVDQMRDRVRYDLLYLQNISLNSDLNIIFKTVKVMVQGKGK
ncbi:exopolysaccharide biosynthesis polyprenyl glycosylphosphotransferase [Mucilaginibacter gracilis]|uniref:Exopolysaccharide biosynthesis polyprenyl glycosylphosphotransferase n=1 Tax=Mucilaginibacter gracilis TaxID=423350 RepID=A0A495IZ02_9SPHI|nr:sugar transferase [Mucilaginibacter gracilis]RKR81069.1 exopolysaccharide biosynthesis polyprenyl glycosylphosphotransferase [Mucilaginibacter gracilis]